MLQSLIERSGVPDSEDAVLGLASRPGDRPTLLDRQAHLHIAAGLDPGPDDLAVALHRVAVAEEEERAGDENRETHAAPGGEAAIVHIAAVPVARGGGDRLPLR